MASSWQPTFLVNTEAFQTIDDSDSAGDIELRFGDSVDERIYWDRTPGRFRMSDDVYVDGDLTASGILSIEGAVSLQGAVVLNENAVDADVRMESQSNPNLFFLDASANRIGIRKDNPTVALAVAGTISGSIIKSRGALTASGNLYIDHNLQINADDEAVDARLRFGSDTTDETLTFINLEDRFEFSDDLAITGGLSTSGGLVIEAGQTVTVEGVNYAFPRSDGSASGKVLSTDGAGSLSWSDDNEGSGGSPDTGFFTDTTADTAVSLTSVVELWDGTQPNITPTATSQTIFIAVGINETDNDTADNNSTFSIWRAVGTTATCADPSTQVGLEFYGGWNTNTGDKHHASAVFIDSPSTTSQVNYTVCTGGNGEEDTTIDTISVSLVVLGG